MYKIKQKPEDFVVKEKLGVKVKEEGRYAVYKLKKTNYTTERAVQHISKEVRLDRKNFSYAGSKDRKAVTEQYITITRKISMPKLKDIELEFIGCADKPISLGDLKGNDFEIVVRNFEGGIARIDEFPNLFDEQRFSSNNEEIGKAIVKGDFEKAVSLVLKGSGDYEEKVRRHLEKTPNDYVGALKRIPKKILLMFVHACQSGLFNRLARRMMERGERKETLPIVGFATESSIYDEMLEEENIAKRDFIIKAIPFLSSEGSERKMFAEIKNLKTEISEDELNPGKKKAKLKFFLQKGSYATMAVKYLTSRA